MLAVCRSPLVMLALLATLCSAQFPDDPKPPPTTPGTPASTPATAPGTPGGGAASTGAPKLTNANVAPGTRASIAGHVITTHDVLLEARILMLPAGPSPKDLENPPEEVMQHALAGIAREILLASEAKRLGLELSEYELDDLMKSRFSSMPDMEELAEYVGTTPETLRERFRRQLTAQLYEEHRLGLNFRYSHLIQPDPLLKRVMEVRPAQLKEEFLKRRAQFDVPPRVRYRVQAFDDRDAAARAATALALGHEAISNRESAEQTEAVQAAVQSVLRLTGSEELADWIESAPAGAVWEPIALVDELQPQRDEDGPSRIEVVLVVIQVLERLPPRDADFALDQDLLHGMLVRENAERARRALVLEEARKAVVWPPELFSTR